MFYFTPKSEKKSIYRTRSSNNTTTDLAFCPGSKLAFVPVLEPGQGFRDKSLSRLLSRVEEPGQKVPDVKKFFAHYGIRFQDLLLNAWFSCQFT